MSAGSGGSAGAGVSTIAVVVLGTLKLAGVHPVADWSWWVITSPWWATFIVVLLGALIFGTAIDAVTGVGDWFKRRRAMKDFMDEDDS